MSCQPETCSVLGTVCSHFIETSQTEEMDAQRGQETLEGHTAQKGATVLAHFTDEDMEGAHEAEGLFDSRGPPALTV